MSSTFTGDALVLQKLHALATLLSLRNGGQLELLPTFPSAPHSKEYTYSLDSISDSNVDHSRLKCRFLDRFAEIASNKRGGDYVACTVMREYDDHVDIWVARNKGFSEFSEKDFTFFRAFSVEMSKLASHQAKESGASLWALLLAYYSKQLRVYLTQLLAFAKQNRQAVASGKQHIEPLICRFFDMLEHADDFKQLCRISHQILGIGAQAQDKVTALKNGKGLWRNICHLARFQKAHQTFCKIARTASNFGTITIIPVMKNQIVQSTGYLPLSLEETLRLLPHPITTCSVREHVAPGSTARKLEQKFNLRQKDTRRVHAELQMIQCLLQKHIPIQSLFQYMGGSKRNCFLCKTFIEEFCIGFLKTRGCHGKVYHKWMIPEIQGIEQGMVEQLKNTVIEMYDILLKQICQPWRSLDAHPESSGGTTPTTSSAASFASCRRTITRKVKVKKVLTGRLIHHKQITRVFQRMITPSKTAAIAPSLINVHAFWVQQASSVLTDDDGSARVILSQVKSTMRM